MVWETARTWVAGELMTAAKFNTVRNALRLLHNKPTARVYNNANISVPTNEFTILTFNSEYYDNDSLHDTSSETNRLTATLAGVYYISAVVGWASGSNTRILSIKYNGLSSVAATEYRGLSSTQITHSLSTQYMLDVGDYVEVEVYQNHGSALNVEAFNHSPIFSMEFLGAGT